MNRSKFLKSLVGGLAVAMIAPTALIPHDNGLYFYSSGHIGLGTTCPKQVLHITDHWYRGIGIESPKMKLQVTGY